MTLRSYLVKVGGKHILAFCRGDRGCSRSKAKRELSKKHCENCYVPTDENMTIGEVANRLNRGDA